MIGEAAEEYYSIKIVNTNKIFTEKTGKTKALPAARRGKVYTHGMGLSLWPAAAVRYTSTNKGKPGSSRAFGATLGCGVRGAVRANIIYI